MPRVSKACCLCAIASVAVVCLVVYSSISTPSSAAGTEFWSPSSKRPVSYNDSHADDILRSLCDLYKDGLVSGDLCNSLCYYYNRWEIIDYFQSNKHVILLSHGGQKLVLKSSAADFSQFDDKESNILVDLANSDRGGGMFDNDTEFMENVRRKVNEQLELGWQSTHMAHLLPFIWPPYQRNTKLNDADRRSLWALLQQEEYTTFAVLPLARVFPKIMGSCGHFYAVEYVVPFRMKPQYMNLRAKILVHLMGTLKLFHEFLNEPLHWCDAKFENFGLSADYPKRFLLMDADLIFTESRMRRLLSSLHCRSDADCKFVDCTAKCDQNTQHCTHRINDNVEVFCKKFVNVLFTSPYGYRNNRYISACQDNNITNEQRLRDLRVVWAWSLADV